MPPIIMFSDLTLSSPLALVLLLIAVAAGYRYRRTWVAGGSRVRLWCYGILAAASLLALALIPLSSG